MKNLVNKTFLFLAVCVFFTIQSTSAQNSPTTKISYQVDSGPVFPIDGESAQMTGKLIFDDNTNAIESLSFTVPLISFIGSHSGYLGWLGNARMNPDLNFKSSIIKNKVNVGN